MTTYTFATESVTITIDAWDDNDAAVKFAQTEGIKGVTGMGGLLGRIAERNGYATVTDDRGDVVGRIDPNSGRVTIYPQGH